MVAEPTDNELARRRYKLRAVVEGVEPLPPPPVMEGPLPWPLQMNPKIYLRLHPEGQHAAQARELVEAAEQQAASSAIEEEETADERSDE